MRLHTLPTSLPVRKASNDGKYTLDERVEYVRDNGQKLAERWSNAAKLEKDIEALVESDLLKAQCSPGNFWKSDNLVNSFGEGFGGYAPLAQLSTSRLSQTYNQVQGRRQRKLIFQQITDTKMLTKHRYLFLTLTLPFLPTSFDVILNIKERAFTLFRKRKLYVDAVQGAFAAEETIVGAKTTALRTHHHVHAHILLLAEYMKRETIKDEWTDCVEKACKEFNVECLINTPDNKLAGIHIYDVAYRAYKDGKSLDDMISELCKYVVKGSDYHKLNNRDLLLVEKTLKGRQLVRRYGCFNKRGKGNTDVEKKRITFKDTPSLDTKCMVDGKRVEPKAKRAETLKQMGVRLCEEGKRYLWLEVLDHVLDERQQFRQTQLAMYYPHSIFYTLDGKRFGGVSTRFSDKVQSMSDFKNNKQLRRLYEED